MSLRPSAQPVAASRRLSGPCMRGGAEDACTHCSLSQTSARGLDAHPHPAYPRLHAPTHPLAHVMNALIRFLFGARLPIAVCLISALLAGAAVWKFQAMRYEARLARAQAALVSYGAKIASANARLEKAQARVVTRVEVRYRDRIRVLKEKGDAIIKEVPVYVSSEDSARFGVNIGFVRSYNAAFSGIAPSPPAESDREPAGIPLTEIAETNAFNARICRQWKEQALGWRDFYRQLKEAHLQESKSDQSTSLDFYVNM